MSCCLVYLSCFDWSFIGWLWCKIDVFCKVLFLLPVLARALLQNRFLKSVEVFPGEIKVIIGWKCMQSGFALAVQKTASVCRVDNPNQTLPGFSFNYSAWGLVKADVVNGHPMKTISWRYANLLETYQIHAGIQTGITDNSF